MAALNRREVSAVELTESTLRRIEALNPRINAFRDVIADRALADARHIDGLRARGEPLGALAGLPIGIKEIVDTTPAICSAGLSFRSDHRPQQDAAVTAALRQAGAIVTGVTITDPGAFGVRTAEVVHPQQPGLSTGGSSGGSAAALAAELCYATIGTDTGGSIRIPSPCTVRPYPPSCRRDADGVGRCRCRIERAGRGRTERRQRSRRFRARLGGSTGPEIRPHRAGLTPERADLCRTRRRPRVRVRSAPPVFFL